MANPCAPGLGTSEGRHNNFQDGGTGFTFLLPRADTQLNTRHPCVPLPWQPMLNFFAGCDKLKTLICESGLSTRKTQDLPALLWPEHCGNREQLELDNTQIVGASEILDH